MSRIDNIAVIPDRDGIGPDAEDEGLDIHPAAGTGGRIAVVTDGNVAAQLAEGIFIKDLGDQAHIAVELDFLAVGSCDTGAFLAAVLEGKECKKGKPGYVLTGTVNTKDAAFFV